MAEAPGGRVRVADGPKRVRVHLGGELVADVRIDLLTPTATVTHSPSPGDASTAPDTSR
jgi:uncharacterized protein (DUF427 family)